jgi:hypothetical protein
MLLARALVRDKQLDLFRVHVLGHLVSLPFLEGEAEALMAVVLVIGLVFVVFDLDEVRVDGGWVEG